MRRFQWRMAAALAVWIALAAAGRGDGVYIPPDFVETVPNIPLQTAAIFFDGKEETLVVQSIAGAGQGDALAWIIPLPAAPTAIEAGDAAMLDQLRERVRREVHGDLGSSALALQFLYTTVWLSFAWLVVRRCYGRAVFYLLAATFATAMFYSIVFATMGAEVGPSTTEVFGGIEVLSLAKAGSYESAALRAESPEDLQAWLRKEGFRELSNPAEAIVARYIKDGWVFVVSRLARERGKLLAPHPLSLTFPASRPVYPMRLTALAGGETEVSLFVFGPTTYSHPALEQHVTETGRLRADVTLIRTDTEDEQRTNVVELDFHVHPMIPAFLDQPDLTRRFRGDRWITRLEGRVPAAAMQEDFWLKRAATPEIHRDEVWTWRGAIEQASSETMWVWLAGAYSLAIYFSQRRDRWERTHRYTVRSIGWAGAAAIALMFVRATTLPKSGETIAVHVGQPSVSFTYRPPRSPADSSPE